MYEPAVQALCRPGGIAVIPTDTVYGVVARAADPAAVERLYRLKRRKKKPGTLIAASIDQLVELGIPRRFLTAVDQFWPGAVSIDTPVTAPDLSYLSQSIMRLPIRVPDDEAVLQILQVTGPLMTSSANQPGEPTAENISQARDYFGADIDYYLDGGPLSGRQPSTIIRIIDDAIEVVRQGAVTIPPNA